MKIYLSGSISHGGTATEAEIQANLLLFYKAEELFVSNGHKIEDIFNPARLEEAGKRWEEYLARDLTWIFENKPMLYMLKDWEKSLGAKLEHAVAELWGLEICYQHIDPVPSI